MRRQRCKRDEQRSRRDETASIGQCGRGLWPISFFTQAEKVEEEIGKCFWMSAIRAGNPGSKKAAVTLLARPVHLDR